MVSIGDKKGSLGLVREIDRANNKLQEIFTELASGKKRTLKDAAGASIAAALDSSAIVRERGSNNLRDGQSLAAIQSSATNLLVDIRQRQAELATQAANGTVTDEGRSALNEEFQALEAEARRIEESTTFNGQPVFSGESTTIQAGTDGSANSTLVIPSTTPTSPTSRDILTATDAQDAIKSLAEDQTKLSETQATSGAVQSRLNQTEASNEAMRLEELTASARITDIDYAQETADLLNTRIRQDINTALAAQVSKQVAANVLTLLR